MGRAVLVSARERGVGYSIVAFWPPSRLTTEASRGLCCTKSSLTFEIQTLHGILWTVRACKAFGAIAGSGIKTMFEVITAIFGVMSAGIFIAHAVDGYRSSI